MHKIKIKRVYDSIEKSDGLRILVDRLWPRGINKNELNVDLWAKEIAPSNELRQFFNHDQQRWLEFKKLYIQELQNKKDLLNEIMQKWHHNDITLLFAAKDESINNAVVLKEYLISLRAK